MLLCKIFSHHASTETGCDHVQSMIGRQRVMDASYAELLEQKHLLKNLPKLLGYRSQASPIESIASEEDATTLEEGAQTTQDGKTLRMIAGLLNTENKAAFERLVWRVSRGNALVKYAEDLCVFSDTNNEIQVEKDCFIVLFSGQILQDKLGKLLVTLGASRFAIPDSGPLMSRQLAEVTRQVEDHVAVKAESLRQQRQLISTYADDIGVKEVLVLREKAVHDCMNLFNSRISNRTVLAEAWVPKESIHEVEAALRRGAVRARADTPSVLSVIRTRDTPPTYIKKNKLTEAFQVALRDEQTAVSTRPHVCLSWNRTTMCDTSRHVFKCSGISHVKLVQPQSGRFVCVHKHVLVAVVVMHGHATIAVYCRMVERLYFPVWLVGGMPGCHAPRAWMHMRGFVTVCVCVAQHTHAHIVCTYLYV
jgi:hypothetical protein